jgi:hypothetical protein
MALRPVAAGLAAAVVVAAVGVGITALPSGQPNATTTAAAAVESGAPRVLRVVSKQGHRTHPTWYHDTQVLALGDRVTVAWNGDGEVQAAQLGARDLAISAKRRINARALGGATDSTGTDTDRHDVPAVLADGAGRLGFLYGGGSVAAEGTGRDGPLWRSATAPASLDGLAPERALDIGGGAAFDFETVTDRDGTVHAIGQHGRGNTGSLIELRLGADGTWRKPRELIRGGRTQRGCVLHGRPQRCSRFAIARIAVDPDGGRLHLVWGWSEASLSAKCHTDAGYCDHDLDYAYSDDGGATWHDTTGRHTVRIADGPLPADAAAFRVMRGHIGLFKAVAVGPAGPLVVYSSFEAGSQLLMAARLSAGRWRSAPIAPDTTDRGWRGSLVLRGGGTFTLWTPTGEAIHRFRSADGASWAHDVVLRGPAWSLTGTPAATAGEELLLWRGRRQSGHSWVMVGAFPAGR